MSQYKTLYPGAEHYWERGWEEHERLQLQPVARLPLADKLAWLEEAQRIVLHLAAAKSQSRLTGG